MNPDIQAVLEGRSTWCVVTAEALGVLSEMPAASVDHVLTDPPYDEHTHEKARVYSTAEAKPVSAGIDFPPIEPATILASFLQVARRWTLSFCSFEMVGEYAKASGKAWVRCGVYHRLDGAPQFTGDRPAQAAEAIAICHSLKAKKRWNGGGGRGLWASNVERHDRVHPTQKPITLMTQLIELFTDTGELVLDPFCGSGTTGVAAVRQGRRFIGIELQEKYAGAARKRLARAEEAYLEEAEQRQLFEAAMKNETENQRSTFDFAMGL